MTHTRFDTIAAAVVTGIGGFFLVLALQIKTSGHRTAAEALVGPPLVPVIISSIIIALGLLELLAIYLAHQSTTAPKAAPSEEEFEPFSLMLVLRISMAVAIGLAYVWLLSATGYLMASACSLLALLVLFGTRSPVKILLISAIGAAAYYYFFIRLMGVYDPTGWLVNFG